MSNLEIREQTFEPESIDEDKFEVFGRAVPYGVETRIGDYIERFERGSIVADDRGIRLCYQHGEPIGIVTDFEDREDGFYIRAKLARTTQGQDAYTLLSMGALRDFSVGFIPVESRDENGVVVRTKADLREVSVVTHPAYATANISEVREASSNEKETQMTEDLVTRAEVAALTESVDHLERSIALLGENTATTEPEEQFRSYGDFIHAAFRNDERAIALSNRAYDGVTSADGITHDAWYGDLVRELKAKQPVKNAFETGSLPAKGLGVEYAVLKSDTTNVAEQVAEGDLLAFGKVALDVERAGIKTFGGWSSLSRQSLERTDNVSLLDTTWKRLAKRAARAEEAYVRSVLIAALADATTDTGSIATAGDVLDLLLDLNEAYNDSDFVMDGIFVSRDVFSLLANVPEEKTILQVNNTAPDKLGSLSIGSLSAGLAGVNVTVLPGAATGTFVAYDKSAIQTLTSGGPTRLEDEDVTRLTKDISVYFYASSFAQAPEALTKVTLS